MTSSRPRLLLAGFFLLLLPAVARPADTVELRWRFAKGQVLNHLFKHREVRTVAVADQKFATTTESEYELQWTVKERDEQGTATIEQKLTALRVRSNGKDWDFQYDSSRANTSEEEYKKKLIQFYDQLRFTTYRLKLKADGTLAEVLGFDKLQGELGDGLRVNGLSVLEFEGLNLRDDTFAWYLQQVLGTLPRAAVAKGASWNQPIQQKLAGVGEVSGKNDFTLAGTAKVDDLTCQEIRLKGEQALELNLKWVGNNILNGTLKTSKLTGTLRFDAQAGRLATGETSLEMAGDLKLGTAANAAAVKVSFEHTLELEARK